MHEQILAMRLIYVGEKSTNLKHLLVLLSTLHYLEVLIAECQTIASYLKSQYN